MIVFFDRNSEQNSFQLNRIRIVSGIQNPSKSKIRNTCLLILSKPWIFRTTRTIRQDLKYGTAIKRDIYDIIHVTDTLLFTFLFFFFFSSPSSLPRPTSDSPAEAEAGNDRIFLRAGRFSRWNPREINVKFQSRRCVETWHLLNDYLHWTQQTLFILDTSNVSEGREALRNDDGPGRAQTRRPLLCVAFHTRNNVRYIREKNFSSFGSRLVPKRRSRSRWQSYVPWPT